MKHEENVYQISLYTVFDLATRACHVVISSVSSTALGNGRDQDGDDCFQI